MALSSEPPLLPPDLRARAPVHTPEGLPSGGTSPVALCLGDFLQGSHSGPLLSSLGPFRTGLSFIVISTPERRKRSRRSAHRPLCRRPATVMGTALASGSSHNLPQRVRASKAVSAQQAPPRSLEVGTGGDSCRSLRKLPGCPRSGLVFPPLICEVVCVGGPLPHSVSPQAQGTFLVLLMDTFQGITPDT